VCLAEDSLAADSFRELLAASPDNDASERFATLTFVHSQHVRYDQLVSNLTSIRVQAESFQNSNDITELPGDDALLRGSIDPVETIQNIPKTQKW
jgi:hypothetical protein